MQERIKLPSGRVVLLAVATIGILAIPAAIWLIINTKPIPGKFRQGLSYPLYYPASLPKGYKVDRASFQRKDMVIIFNIIAPNGKNIAVAEQHIPPDVDLSQHPHNTTGITLPDQRDFATRAGNAEISFWGDKLVSSLVTDNTWIILNVSGFKMDDAQKITQAFTKL
jgi:hypothetical protein